MLGEWYFNPKNGLKVRLVGLPETKTFSFYALFIPFFLLFNLFYKYLLISIETNWENGSFVKNKLTLFIQCVSFISEPTFFLFKGGGNFCFFGFEYFRPLKIYILRVGVLLRVMSIEFDEICVFVCPLLNNFRTQVDFPCVFRPYLGRRFCLCLNWPSSV